jgi:hypothetical protein
MLEVMAVMDRSKTFVLACCMMGTFSLSALAAELKNGLHGLNWTDSSAQHGHLVKVREAEHVAYYVNGDTIYQVGNQPVPGVVYGFYQDQFFAVYIKLRSPEQFAQMKRHFSSKYGAPKVTSNPDIQQSVYRWNVDDVKIKLKVKESLEDLKLAIYYAPLALKANQEPLEGASAVAPDVQAPEGTSGVQSAPLLNF